MSTKRKTKFLKENNLDVNKWPIILVDCPGELSADELSDLDEDELALKDCRGTEFYLRLEFLGNKHFFTEEVTEDMVKWMQLTEKLFM